MFIQELRVEGYGALHNVDVKLETPVTVILGPNEAGKSTLLRFIRSMLYGIPTRKDPVERGEPVFGGRHGGRMAVLAHDGRALSLERYADGSSGGRKIAGGLAVRDGNGTELRWTQPEWERLVLGGVSERLFRQLFAVSLDELHELLTLQGDEIGNFLYHAGLAGGASLADARRKLSSEMDKLYRPRGVSQELNRLLASIKEMEATIRQSRSTVVLFQECSQEMAIVQQQLETLEMTTPGLAAKAAMYQGALDARELWLKRQLLLEEERELTLRLPNPAVPPLPEEAAAEWTNLLRQRKTASDRLANAAQRVRERRAELESLVWDAQLLKHDQELEKLEAMREAAAARQEERESVATELRLVDDTMEALLPRLSPDWEEADLLAFPSITSEREPLRRLQTAWGEAVRTRERLEADAGRIERQREALRQEMDDVRRHQDEPAHSPQESHSRREEPFGPFRPRTRESLQAAWNALEDEVRRLEREWPVDMQPQAPYADRLPVSPGRRGMPKSDRSTDAWSNVFFTASLLLGIAALILLVLAVIGTVKDASFPVYLTGVAATALLSALAGWAGARKKGTTRGDSSRPALGSAISPNTVYDLRKRATERLRDLLADSADASDALFGPSGGYLAEPMSDDAWKRLRQAFQDALAGIERSDRESARAQQWQRRLAELDREHESLQKDMQRNAVHLDELYAEWTDRLRRYKMPMSLQPDDLPELLSLAEQVQALLRRRARAEERLSALAQLQASFQETAAALFAVCPPPASMASDAALSVSWLHRRAAEQRAVQEEAARTERTLKEASTIESEARRLLLEAETAINKALENGSAGDETAYEMRLHIDESRRTLLRERREIELRLEAGRTVQSVTSLNELLESHDEAALSALYREAEEASQTANRNRTELLDRRGRLAQELERLQREAETEDWMTRLSEWESQLERLAERYAILAVSDRLMQDTKAVYEEERQPEVLRLATRYFAGMTNGAYTRISVSVGNPSILAETRDGRVTDSAFLSRGTQEQLYLAMRFALAEAASREVPLPLLLDDLFVHFDDRRLRQTIPVLEEIAQTRQVILFTCHQHVAEAVREGMSSARIMTWEARREEGGAGRDPGPSGKANPG